MASDLLTEHGISFRDGFFTARGTTISSAEIVAVTVKRYKPHPVWSYILGVISLATACGSVGTILGPIIFTPVGLACLFMSNSDVLVHTRGGAEITVASFTSVPPAYTKPDQQADLLAQQVTHAWQHPTA